MADSFKFTLYELFGYFVPGVVALAAVSLADLVVFHHSRGVHLGWCFSTPGLVTGAVLAYVLGHSVQIIANWILPKSNDEVLRLPRYADTQELLERVRKSFPAPLAGITDQNAINICEQEVQAEGPASEREIYVYREGFYRGMLIGLTVFAVTALVVGAINSYAVFLSTWGVTRSEDFLCGILAGLIAWGMYGRSLRFANYRVKQAFMYHLACKKEGKDKKEDKEEPTK